MTIWAVTAFHNRRAVAERFVRCLLSQTCEEEIRLVAVDDGSTDGTAQSVRELFPAAELIAGNGRLFWGGSMQKIYLRLRERVADDDVVFYANDDSQFEPDFIALAANALRSRPNDLLTGCGYGVKTGYYLDGPVHFSLENGAVTNPPAGSEGNCASTRALFLTGRVYRELGGFHPILIPHYASDYEYTLRANRRGHRIFSDPSVRYRFTEDTTGDNTHRNLSFKKIFSKRSKLNPFYKINFFIMVAPLYRMPQFIAYQFRHFRHHDRDRGKAV